MSLSYTWCNSKELYLFFFFFEREKEFQPMVSAPNNSSLSLDQDTNQFFV